MRSRMFCCLPSRAEPQKHAVAGYVDHAGNYIGPSLSREQTGFRRPTLNPACTGSSRVVQAPGRISRRALGGQISGCANAAISLAFACPLKAASNCGTSHGLSHVAGTNAIPSRQRCTMESWNHESSSSTWSETIIWVSTASLVVEYFQRSSNNLCTAA